MFIRITGILTLGNKGEGVKTVSDEGLVEFYGMPEGEIPYSVYEDKKVRELSERVRSRHGSGKSGEVHIISGRMTDQVRRIAYLTAKRLIASGITVLSSDEMGEEYGSVKNKEAPVLLLDEDHLKASLQEGGDLNPVRVFSDLEAFGERSGKGYSVLFSLSQELYESKFKEAAESSMELGQPSDIMKRGKRGKTAYSGKGNRNFLWMAFIFPAFSFLLMPMAQLLFLHSMMYMQEPVASSLMELSLILVPLALSSFGLVLLFLASVSLESRSRSIALLGIFLLAAEILVPLIMFATGILGVSYRPLHSNPLGDYSMTSLLSLVFQLIALSSFALIILPYTDTKQKAGLAGSLVAGLAYLISVFAFYSPGSIPYSITLRDTIIVAPYVIPYNSIAFGFAFGGFDSIATVVMVLSFISQWMLCGVYAWVGISIRMGPNLESRVTKTGGPASS